MTLIDDQNRRIMIGWMNIWFAEMPEKKDGWVGAMTVSRKLSYQNNQLYQYPVKEIEELRYDGVSTSEIMISNQNDFSTQLHEAADIEIEIDLEKSKAEVFSIYLKASETVDEYIELLVDLTKGKLTCIREKSGAGEKTGSTAPFFVDILLSASEHLPPDLSYIPFQQSLPAPDSSYFRSLYLFPIHILYCNQ